MPRQITTIHWPSFVVTLRSEPFGDMTQQQLAVALKATVTSVSNWETGAVEPQHRHRQKLKKLAERKGFDDSLWPRKLMPKPVPVRREATRKQGDE